MRAFNSIIENKIIAVARQIYGEDLINLAKALHKGGINNIELTFDQANSDCIIKTFDGIRALSALDGICVGAGTVLDLDQLFTAQKAGAEYIVSPNTNVEIIRATKEIGLVSIPGAITSTEIINASRAGADFIKIFPAAPAGLEYIKALCIPLNHIKFIANAGISLENIKDFFEIGFVAAGISNYLCDKKLIEKKEWKQIEERARLISNIVKKQK